MLGGTYAPADDDLAGDLVTPPLEADGLASYDCWDDRSKQTPPRIHHLGRRPRVGPLLWSLQVWKAATEEM